ncbi:DNA/RNA helicase domain-containing protein [Metabacillus sp. HB246100]
MTNHYSAKTVKLTDQMRMKANSETINWINCFVAKEVLPLPSETGSSFELKLFDQANSFKSAIVRKNNEVGLSRIVSTFDYLHKKDNQTYIVDEEGINMPWNNTTNTLAWAEIPESIKEVGSIYTVQGFDLNYVGVVLAPSISYNRDTNKLIRFSYPPFFGVYQLLCV